MAIFNYIIPNLLNFAPYNVHLDIISNLVIKFQVKKNLDFAIDINLLGFNFDFDWDN